MRIFVKYDKLNSILVTMKKRFIISIPIFIVLLILIVKNVDIPQIVNLIKSFPIQGLMFAVIAAIGVAFIKSLRFFLLVRSANIKASYKQVLKVYLAGQATTSLPGGESFRSILLKKEVNITITKSAGPVAGQAIAEFVCAIIIACIGSYYFTSLRFVFSMLLVGTVIFLYILLYKDTLTKILSIAKRFRKVRQLIIKLPVLQKNIRKIFFRESARLHTRKTLITTILLTLLGQAAGGALLYIITQGFNLPLTLFHCIYLYAALIVTSAISGIIPGGFGLSEGAVGGIMVLLKVSLTSALGAIVLFRLVNSVLYTTIGIIIFLPNYGKDILIKRKL